MQTCAVHCLSMTTRSGLVYGRDEQDAQLQRTVDSLVAKCKEARVKSGGSAHTDDGIRFLRTHIENCLTTNTPRSKRALECVNCHRRVEVDGWFCRTYGACGICMETEYYRDSENMQTFDDYHTVYKRKRVVTGEVDDQLIQIFDVNTRTLFGDPRDMQTKRIISESMEYLNQLRTQCEKLGKLDYLADIEALVQKNWAALH